MTKSSSFPGTNAQKSSAPWMKSFFLSLKALVPYRYISVSQVTVHKRFIMIKTKPVAFQNITMKINRYTVGVLYRTEITVRLLCYIEKWL